MGHRPSRTAPLEEDPEEMERMVRAAITRAVERLQGGSLQLALQLLALLQLLVERWEAEHLPPETLALEPQDRPPVTYSRWVWLAEEVREATQEILLTAILQEEELGRQEGPSPAGALAEYLAMAAEIPVTPEEEGPQETQEEEAPQEIREEEEDNPGDSPEYSQGTPLHRV